MGFFEKLKAEFIDIVEWLDPSDDTMVYRFERYHNEIKNGAKLVVRESQVAVFVNEGQVADVFQPGTYTLETKNLPILATLKGWKYGFNSPFKAEVYFANTKNFTDRKWGTKKEIPIRDADYGNTFMRAFGTYTMRLKDPVKVIREIAGTDGNFTVEQITDQLRNIIVTRFADAAAQSKIPVFDMATKYDELSDLVHKKIQPEFDEYGLELTKFLVENVSFPPELEESINARASMGAIGDMGAYMQYQTAKSVPAAAANPGGGGLAAGGMGMGMGFGMAHQMVGAFGQSHQVAPQHFGGAAPPPVPGSVQFHVVVNGQQAGPYNDTTLRQMVQQKAFTPDTLVWKQGMSGWAKAAQVQELAGIFTPAGPPPPPPPPAP